MNRQKNDAPLFDLFWENSNLNDKNTLNFVESFEKDRADPPCMQYATVDLQLNYPKDKLFEIMAGRYSAREYHAYPLPEKALSSLFSCFAQMENHRLLPSAGGKYPIEVYALCFHVKGKLNQKIVYYNHNLNALSIIGNCMEWQHIEKYMNTAGIIRGNPSILFLFVAFPGRMVAKYGERGGRFLLIEAGQYLQNLNLRIVHEKLKAVELGGIYDREMINMLKLENTDAIIPLGLICGK